MPLKFVILKPPAHSSATNVHNGCSKRSSATNNLSESGTATQASELQTYYVVFFSYVFVLFVLVLALTPSSDAVSTVFTALSILAESVNPMMPVALVWAQSVAAYHLDKHHAITCLAPVRIPIAGKLHAFVFDKTGTITQDGMDLTAVRPVDAAGASFAAEI